MNKTTVIHHSADFDGIFCREIARKFLPEAELIGWDYGDPKIPFPTTGTVYILDLSPDCVELPPCDGENERQAHLQRIVWIDHHKSSIEKWQPNLPGYRIDGVAACRLAWFYFTALERYKKQTETADFTWFQGHYPWATKQDFIARKVSEPLAVRLAGEYDIWDKRDPDAEVFQFGLRSQELMPFHWRTLLDETVSPTLQGTGMEATESELLTKALLNDGRMLQRYQQQTDASVVNYRSFLVEFEGLKFLALNTARCNSLTFAARDIPETGHDALMGFYFTGEEWKVSLYHARHRTDLDLSLLAVKHGGGGHRGACGFQATKLPFIP